MEEEVRDSKPEEGSGYHCWLEDEGGINQKNVDSGPTGTKNRLLPTNRKLEGDTLWLRTTALADTLNLAG